MNKEKREKKMSQRRPRKRSYPRRDFTPAEQQMFEKIIGNLKPYTEQKARTECVDKKGTKGWPWQSIMSCYGQQGLGIGPGSRYASEILPYEESYLRRKGLKGIPNYVAANLTAGANLGKKIREQKPQTAAAEIAKILGGYPVPWNQIAEGQGIGPGQFDYLFNPESKERERKRKNRFPFKPKNQQSPSVKRRRNLHWAVQHSSVHSSLKNSWVGGPQDLPHQLLA